MPGREAKMNMQLLGEDDIHRLEAAIDEADAACAPLKTFVLPGGSAQAAALHLARTVCRRAERAVLAIDDAPVRSEVAIYLNRLSDLLFRALARRANAAAGVDDVPWNSARGVTDRLRRLGGLSLVRFAGHLRREEAPGSMQTAHDGPDGNPELTCRIEIRSLLEIDHHHDRPKALWQRIEGATRRVR